MTRVEQSANFHEERAELDTLLSSGLFARAPGLAQFLGYICQRYFEGESEKIKEYNIAVEALGRPAHFDQKTDAIVRVEAYRLRKRLKEYYEQVGAGRPLEIAIPPGSYVPVFRKRADEPVAARAPESLPARRARADHLVAWTVAAGLALAVLAGAAMVAVRVAREDASGGRAGSRAAMADNPEVRILAGALSDSYVDRLGQRWPGDRFFRGGRAAATPGAAVERTSDPNIYRHRREGDFDYDIPLRPGVYELRLHFAETVFGTGKAETGGETSRLFDVTLNGKPLLGVFDVVSDAGGSGIGDTKVFKDASPAPDGLLHLAFRSRKASAILNGIEIVPSTRGRMRPIRILAQDVMYVDGQGRVWAGDRYFRGGQTVVRENPVTNVPEPAIYRGERYGNFTYTIPVAPGQYSIALRFAETWFGPRKSAGGGAGSRIFDVYCNGVALLKNFDIYREAGGSDIAIDRTFGGLTPNAQDKFVLQFVPVRNYACVNAIEVE